MNKEEILQRIEDFRSEQLFEFINTGLVTLEELRSTGDLPASKRNAIIKLTEAKSKEEKDFWNQHQNTEDGCNEYIKAYPYGQFIQKAKSNIEVFRNKIAEEERTKKETLELLKKNLNNYTPNEILGLLQKGTILREDLLKIGIPNEVIESLGNIETPRLNLGKTPDSIPEGYTEVYFWGIPGSGKTCVLSALLSTAHKNNSLEIAVGPGYDYTNRLRNIFINPISFLPAGTTTDSTQYLPFTIRKGDEDPRSVSLIELSGEIFKCFYSINANLELDPDYQKTLNSLLNFLNSDNRKIHFFFIDFENKNRQDGKGYTQANYLEAAATYFQNNDIFRKHTDAIYIIITKSDLMACDKAERKNHLKEYLQNANFNSFVSSLRNRCREHSINSGKILGTHFSLGTVYFNEICSFDPETSENLIDILLRRIKPNKKSILDIFNK
ncbi:hypothetical protein [Mongoliitalea lutea]|uniref:Uncharacterized protein n=1 Tax=Mongoliitalea lutea TaxID=849756 RepID=A0A8J3G552_9BACT|nr:hypothetical protein [Mongoliitalea lutea]GHB36299.1 hypothetical protein GCM10008106_16980 [Mongoliitalea lutea]